MEPPKHILIAEDDTAVRESLERAIRLEGYEVTTAVNGQKTLELAATNQPDTSDIMVPSTTDMEPIKWNGNDAAIDGTLYEVGLYYKRVGLFQALFEHRAVVLSNGKTPGVVIAQIASLYLLRAHIPTNKCSKFNKECIMN